MSLYDRQLKLNIDNDISILVCGCGGVGYWVAKYAAMAGVNNIYLFDDDTIEESNLNRIDLPTAFIGRNKAEATKIAIKAIRPNCVVNFYPFKFMPKLDPLNNKPIDYFVDCTDQFEVQRENFNYVSSKGIRYIKVGYDGLHISIANRPAMWGEDRDGYSVVPSFVCSASVVAALAVTKMLVSTINPMELSSTMKDMFI